jgi:hypothetical protein
MSRYKCFLRGLESIALVLGAGMFLAALSQISGLLKPESLERPLVVAFPVTMLVWLIAVVLSVEFFKPRNQGKTWIGRMRGPDTAELLALVRFCPRPMLILVLISAIAAFFMAFASGPASWTFGEPLSVVAATGLFATGAAFNLLAVPVIASVARTPGAFDAQQAVQGDGPASGGSAP